MCSSNSFHNSYYRKYSDTWIINDFEHVNELEKKVFDLRCQEVYYEKKTINLNKCKNTTANISSSQIAGISIKTDILDIM